MSQPFNITISVPSGNPDKLRIIEKTNRLSQALVFNRSELIELTKTRKELEYTGVYMLVNSSGDSFPEIYVGEGESVLSRLKSHSKDTKKEFWEWVVVFVNRDNSLHKGHIQHVEASLVERATSNKRCILNNDAIPRKPSLPESVLFEAEDLLNDIYHIVPLLGISAFESVTDTQAEEHSEMLYLRTKGLTATGFTAASKLVVKQGSQAVKEDTASISKGFSNWRATLTEQGVLQPQGEYLTFSQDYTFESPSTAAAVIMGRNANGRIEWRTNGGVKLKEMQERGLNGLPQQLTTSKCS